MSLVRSILVAALLAFTSAVGFTSAADRLAGADDRWIEIRTTHFTVFGNAARAEVEKAGLGLESLRQSLARLQPGKKLNSPRPTFIYVFKNSESFAPFRFRQDGDGAELAGQFISGDDGNFIGLASQAGSRTQRVVFHEYLHYFLHNNMPEIPTWLDEGLAEYYSTFGRLGDAVSIGRPIMSHSQTLMKQGYMPMPDLLRVTPASRAYNESERSSLFYAQSWLLVHYIYNADPALREQLAQYLERIGRGESREEAFTTAFETDFDSFQERLERYRHNGEFPYVRIAITDLELDTRTTMRELALPETLTALGNLLTVARDDEPRIAERYFKEALRIDARHASAWTGLGLVLTQRQQSEEADAMYRKALALAPDDAIALKRLGFNRLNRYLADDPGSPAALAAIEEAESVLERSVGFNPEWGEAQALYGKVLLLRKSCDKGIPALSRAWELLPSVWEVPHDLAILLAGCGRLEEAKRLIDEVLTRAPDPSVVASATDGVVSAELEALAPLFEQGRFEEAERRTRLLLDRVRGPEMREQMLSHLAELEALNRHNRLVARYNEGIEHYNAGRFAPAHDAFNDVVGQIEDPDLAAEARRMRDRAARRLDRRRGGLGIRQTPKTLVARRRGVG